MESRRIPVGDIRMRWEEAGEGVAVVLLHGIPTSPRLWRRVVPRLRGARALAWEMVGYGGSIPEGRERDLSVARQAEYLTMWLDAAGIDRAILVGHDLGGGIAQILAVRSPERVRGLVLTNSISYDSWPIPALRALRALGPVVGRLPDGAFRLLLRLLFRQGHEDSARTAEAVREHGRYYLEADGAAALVRQARWLDVRDTLEIASSIPTIDCPARLVWGAADPFQPIGYGYRLAYETGAPLDRIEGGRHFVPEDHPDRIAGAVNELIERSGAVE